MKKVLKKEEGYKKAINFLLFNIIFITTSFLVLVFKSNMMVYNLIVMLPSVIFLLLNIPKQTNKIVLEGAILGTFATIAFDIFAHQSKAWYTNTIFAIRPFGFPIEDLIWVILYTLIIISYYEYFFDSYKGKKLPNIHKKYLVLIVLLSLLVPIIYSFFPNIFIIPYFYFVSVVALIIFDLIILKSYPKFASKAVIASLTLLPLAFVHEFVSLELKHWIFEVGYHIGYLNLAGYLIPYEELLFYIAAPIALIGIYELVIDNKKA